MLANIQKQTVTTAFSNIFGPVFILFIYYISAFQEILRPTYVCYKMTAHPKP